MLASSGTLALLGAVFGGVGSAQGGTSATSGTSARSAAAVATVTRASLSFNYPTAGQTVTSLVVGGAYASYVTAVVVTANAGRAVSVSNPGYTNAIDFPAYVPLAQSPPIAIVKMRSKTSSVDPLNGGYGSFTWRADFSLDDYLGNQAVDGDNLLQRGLSPQKQWKLSVDAHRVQCNVRINPSGPVVKTPLITIPFKTTNVRWYRAFCNRSATGVLSIRVYAYSNASHAWVSFASGTAPGSAAGSLNFNYLVPVTVGGKLKDTGAVAFPTPDQFNGQVDNVLLTEP
ncbi:MAG: hypothetical protein M3P23_00375 [Actinomycetota bacterium]|nr:hypothetical protein [Actinomycetota bacterium]